MNKQLIIAAVILVLVGGGLYMYQTKNSTTGDAMKKTIDDAQDDLGVISGSLKDLAAKGVPMQCSFTHTAETGDSAGTVYVVGDNMRGDFAIKQPNGTELKSHIIRHNNVTYSWSDDQNTGMKMTMSDVDVEAMKKNVEGMMKDNPQQFDVDSQNMDYSCSPWLPSPTSFNPPSNITFTDLSAQMKKVQESMGGSMKAACAACENAPAGDARDQCKKALGCE
jgi:hypothetical protein